VSLFNLKASRGRAVSKRTLHEQERPSRLSGRRCHQEGIWRSCRQIREEKGLSLEEAEAVVKQAVEKVDLSRAARALGIVARRLREEQKLSCAQLSSASGLTLRFIINLERGKAHDALLTDIVRICYALNIAPTDFISQVELRA
jgi:DNA-binding Xre family transcriptional regulator